MGGVGRSRKLRTFSTICDISCLEGSPYLQLLLRSNYNHWIQLIKSSWSNPYSQIMLIRSSGLKSSGADTVENYYMLLTTCCLLIAACCLPLAACCLPLAACRLLLATCHLPLTGSSSLFRSSSSFVSFVSFSFLALSLLQPKKLAGKVRGAVQKKQTVYLQTLSKLMVTPLPPTLFLTNLFLTKSCPCWPPSLP